jgi:DnaB-like helicase N terminal domain/Protein of unknown function (DUF3987)
MMNNNDGYPNGSHGIPIVGGRINFGPRSDRLPPQHLEAEKGVIGSILIDEEGAIADKIMGILEASHFYRDAHSKAFAALKRLHEKGDPLCLVSLVHELGDDEYERVGGDEYLEEIIRRTPHAANGVYYAEIVKEMATNRELMEAAEKTIDDGYSNQFTAQELVARAADRVLTIEAANSAEDEDELIAGAPLRMGDAAFRGFAGVVAQAILPETETCVEALLLQFIVAVGNVVGVGPHSYVGATPHRCNLFHCLVGPSGCGKGLGWDATAWLLGMINPDFTSKPFLTGMTSGEGVIIEAKELSGPVLAVETEFARTLSNMNRDGNTLNSILRQAFESKRLRIPTKNSPVIVEGAHLSIIAHIPPSELKGKLSPSDISNGLVNRFLWGGAYMSKLLSKGGRIGNVKEALDVYFRPIEQAIDFARALQSEMVRDAKAEKLWDSVYPSLRIRPPGPYGDSTSRAAALTLRLSMIYALLDGEDIIRQTHVESALAVWDYCDQTAKTLFGDGIFDVKAAKLMDALSDSFEGLNRRQIITQVFRNHITKAELNRILENASGAGQIVYMPKKGDCTKGGVWMHRKYVESANIANMRT